MTGMPVTRDARALIAVTGCRIRDTDLPPVAVKSSRDRTPTARMSPRARRADGAMARGRLGAPTGRTGPASGRHSGPQGRGGEDPNRRDGSRLGTSPPTDEMAYSRRRNGRDGLEPPPGALGRPPAGTRGSAKPGRMTRRQASVSATHFLPGGLCGGPDHAGSCRWDSIERPPRSRAVPCRPPSRNAGTCDKRCLPLPCTQPAER